MATKLPFAKPATESQWAQDLLAFEGTPAAGPSDPRVAFLTAWESDEATFGQGNVNNPLDVEQGTGANAPAGEAWAAALPTSGKWNPQGVAVYPDVTTGLVATDHTLRQAFDAPIFQGLTTPGSSTGTLTNDLAMSNWSGSGPGSAEETSYARSVASDLGGSDVGAGTLTGITFPGGVLDPLNLLTGSTQNTVLHDVANLVLKGVLTLLGAGLVFYGLKLTTERSGGGSSSSGLGPAAAGGAPAAGSETPLEAFPEEALLA